MSRLACSYLLVTCLLFALAAFLHLSAPPDYPGEHFTLTHRSGAAVANALGPYGVLAVRLVGFPNRDGSGYPVFDPLLAIPLTIALGSVLFVAARARRPWLRAACFASYVPLIVLWFGMGLLWIADGRL